MRITITGSLGHIGEPLASHLLNAGHAVTVISSKSGKEAPIKALGAIPAIGSVSDADFLTAAFTGADAVFAMIPPNFSAPDIREYYRSVGRSYATAIRQSGVRRVVHLSSWGAHLPEGTGFITGSYDVEQMLDTLPGISLTHLRPGSFYYNLEGFIGMIRHAGFIASNYGGEDKVVMVAPQDIALVAAGELALGQSGKIRYIASEDITASTIASILGKAIGQPDLKWLTLTDSQAMEGLLKAGIPESIAKLYVELGAAIHDGRMREDYDKNPPAQFGSTSLVDYAKQFAMAFRK
ncbi:MAG: NAD-dependent epimerase/dehydratase family protein [Chitinophagaceae bacterium]|nr:MAG: NAD-dependent epimerase/dehydratase family protein [Chitinophagaceae bacterium]